MNSKFSSFFNNRGVLVILAIICAVIFGLIISIMVNTSNFDNASVQGSYTGNVTFQDQDPMQLNITFDGENDISGVLTIGGVQRPFVSDYIVEGTDITFSISFEDTLYRFIGSVQAGSTVLAGEAQYISSDSEEFGTFFLSFIPD